MADMNFVKGSWNILQSTEDGMINYDFSQKRVEILGKGKKIHIVSKKKRKKKDTYYEVGKQLGVYTKKFLFIPLPVKLFITGTENGWILVIRKNLLTKRMTINVMGKNTNLDSEELLTVRKIVKDCEDGERYLKYLKSVNED